MMKYRLFGRSGLRVSEISLGTMTFGTEWGWGADYETSKAVFDAYANAGGNFIDTANRYTEGTSEKWVGEFMAEDRDHFVLATKFSLFDRRNDPNYSGNHRKNLIRSVETSLDRLNTEYIDLLWLHAWDFTTPVDEVMRGLDDLISLGMIHYIGISDTPAWVVARANTLAELRGWTQFTGYQVEYSLIQRTPEREILPMAKEMGLAITPWAPLAGGALTGKYLKDNQAGRLKPESSRLNERSTQIAIIVVEEAEKLGVTPAQLAIKWTMQKDQVMIPIVGATKESQITDGLEAVQLDIPQETMDRLNEGSAIEMGFPHNFLTSDGVKDVLFGGSYDQINFKR